MHGPKDGWTYLYADKKMGLCIIIRAMEVLAIGVDGNHWVAKSKALLQLFLGELTDLMFLPVG